MAMFLTLDELSILALYQSESKKEVLARMRRIPPEEINAAILPCFVSALQKLGSMTEVEYHALDFADVLIMDEEGSDAGE